MILVSAKEFCYFWPGSSFNFIIIKKSFASPCESEVFYIISPFDFYKPFCTADWLQVIQLSLQLAKDLSLHFTFLTLFLFIDRLAGEDYFYTMQALIDQYLLWHPIKMSVEDKMVGSKTDPFHLHFQRFFPLLIAFPFKTRNINGLEVCFINIKIRLKHGFLKVCYICFADDIFNRYCK